MPGFRLFSARRVGLALPCCRQAEAQWEPQLSAPRAPFLRRVGLALPCCRQAEAQWDRERTRLVDIATDNREAILTVLTESLLGKRSQPETQPAADAADEEA